MAYQHNGPAPNNGKFYNVEQAVGLSGVNASGDVKLVQYMLRSLYGSEAAALVVDGWIGPNTISWIRRFQQDSKASGINVLVDARIDRAFAEISTVSKTVYTMLALNRALRKKDPDAYAKIPVVIPLNKVPRPNPYNPAVRKVVSSWRHYTAEGWEIRNTYSDGTTETILVKGAIIDDGVAYHGFIIESHVVLNFKGEPIALMEFYEDGFERLYPIKHKHPEPNS
ncbi:MAG: hypothetical protein NTW74_14815 [Acidobacteria bacterium]|nr:hypothetical protein [Acidobacteriota bacterium]